MSSCMTSLAAVKKVSLVTGKSVSVIIIQFWRSEVTEIALLGQKPRSQQDAMPFWMC